MALWARVHGVEIEAWAAACEARGVVFQTARRFTFDGRKRQFVRLGFAGEPEARLERAARKMAEAAASLGH
jgi:GntR family transcriptional regulator/MocR family aminotransferase